jgi:hypothetical protein
MRILKARFWRLLGTALAAAMLLALIGSTPGSHAAPPAPQQAAEVTALSGGTFNIHLDLPHGSSIEYLRLYYYDTVTANGHAWLTRYDDGGVFADVLYVASAHSGGYGTTLSDHSGHIVDSYGYSYVLNWRPDDLSPGLQLCGLRVAYRLDGGASISYEHVAGTALRPRDGGTAWRYGGNGCLYQVPIAVYLPLIVKDP